MLFHSHLLRGEQARQTKRRNAKRRKTKRHKTKRRKALVDSKSHIYDFALSGPVIGVPRCSTREGKMDATSPLFICKGRIYMRRYISLRFVLRRFTPLCRELVLLYRFPLGSRITPIYGSNERKIIQN